MRSFIPICTIHTEGATRFFSFESAHVKKFFRSVQMSKKQHLQEIAQLSLSRRSFVGKDTHLSTNVETAKQLSEELVARGLDVVIGGSMAVGMVAPPRQTKDIDINISSISEDALRKLLQSVEGTDLTGEIPKSRSLIQTKSIVVPFEYKGWPIDAYVCPEPKDELRERIFETPLIEEGLKFVPPDVMCALKMMSFKEDDRWFKDRADVLSLLKCAKELDKDWIRKQIVLRDGENGPRVKEWDELIERACKQNE